MSLISALLYEREMRRYRKAWEARARRLAIEESAYRWATSFGRKASPAA